MRNTKFPMALLCLFLTIHTIAQSPMIRKFSTAGVLENAQTMPTNAIADDFGPRDLAKTYWHGGIDFNSAQNDGDNDFWDLIISPQAGIIADFDRLTHGADRYKYGLVNVTDDEGNGSHTLLFGHVFDWNHQFYDEFGSRIVLKRCVDFPDKWGLHLNFTDSAGNVIRHTYGQVDGAILNVNGVNYTTTNRINTNDIFIPLGKSGGTPVNRYKAHLHLNTLPYDTEITGSLPTSPNGDPAQFLDIDRPQYEISVRTESNPDSLAFVYPGTSPTKVRVRTQMIGEPTGINRYSKLMDMDKVELQIKKAISGTYARIKGDEIEAVISEGSRLGEPPVNHSNPVTKSDWKQTGIHSNAYNVATNGDNARNPWDDYYFTDIKTRIHKDDAFDKKTKIADVPSNSRYGDDRYTFRVKATTSNNGVTYSNEQHLKLDNYLPYLTEVNIKYNGDPLHQTLRVGDEGSTNADDGYIMNQIHEYPLNSGLSLPNTITIEVKTSEPMQNVRMAYVKEPLMIFSSGVLMVQDATDRYKWTGNITTAFGTGDCFKVRFSGQDMSGNELINIYHNTDGNAMSQSVYIPTRRGTGAGSSGWNHLPAGGVKCA